MDKIVESAQLQIRVTADQKRFIARAARRAGMDMSAYVLGRVLGVHETRGAAIRQKLADERTRRYAFAELHDLLASCGTDELRREIEAPPPESLPAEVANYAAAMIEHACGRLGIEAPEWTRTIAPLATPVFGSRLESLRLHLLTQSPPPFRRRNIFIDTSIGGRI